MKSNLIICLLCLMNLTLFAQTKITYNNLKVNQTFFNQDINIDVNVTSFQGDTINQIWYYVDGNSSPFLATNLSQKISSNGNYKFIIPKGNLPNGKLKLVFARSPQYKFGEVANSALEPIFYFSSTNTTFYLLSPNNNASIYSNDTLNLTFLAPDNVSKVYLYANKNSKNRIIDSVNIIQGKVTYFKKNFNIDGDSVFDILIYKDKLLTNLLSSITNFKVIKRYLKIVNLNDNRRVLITDSSFSINVLNCTNAPLNLADVNLYWGGKSFSKSITLSNVNLNTGENKLTFKTTFSDTSANCLFVLNVRKDANRTLFENDRTNTNVFIPNLTIVSPTSQSTLVSNNDYQFYVVNNEDRDINCNLAFLKTKQSIYSDYFDYPLPTYNLKKFDTLKVYNTVNSNAIYLYLCFLKSQNNGSYSFYKPYETSSLTNLNLTTCLVTLNYKGYMTNLGDGTYNYNKTFYDNEDIKLDFSVLFNKISVAKISYSTNNGITWNTLKTMLVGYSNNYTITSSERKQLGLINTNILIKVSDANSVNALLPEYNAIKYIYLDTLKTGIFKFIKPIKDTQVDISKSIAEISKLTLHQYEGINVSVKMPSDTGRLGTFVAHLENRFVNNFNVNLNSIPNKYVNKKVVLIAYNGYKNNEILAISDSFTVFKTLLKPFFFWDVNGVDFTKQLNSIDHLNALSNQQGKINYISDLQGVIKVGDYLIPGNHKLTAIFTPDDTNYDTTSISFKIPINVTTKVSIESIENLINIYPIPTKDIINIDLGNVSSNLLIQILNSNGQIKYSNQILKNTNAINLNTLGSKGLYVIRIYDLNNNIILSRKLILE